jgi:hypothetical protein
LPGLLLICAGAIGIFQKSILHSLAVRRKSQGGVVVLRIATWNLERPRQTCSRRIPYILKRLREIEADIWVLTETNGIIDLSDTHSPIASDPVTSLHSPGENWTTIWLRSGYHAQSVPTYDPTISVCAEVDAPGGPLVIYGTVLPYHADRGWSGGATNWSEHYRAIGQQGADWHRIRDKFPGHRFCIAGDLNQSRDGLRWPWGEYYGTKEGRELLKCELDRVRLKCVTEINLLAARKLTTRSTIDHICLDTSSAIRVQTVDAWEAGCGDGVRLSDHNGISIDLPSE